MAEETLDLESENINKSEERIKNLSSKVREVAEARDVAMREAEEARAALAAAEKEKEFFASFTDQLAKFPAASEFKDQIKEKVLAGYTPEDATVAVLNANQRLIPQEAPPMEVGPIAGGSAPTNLSGSSQPQTRDEMRARLLEADAKGELAEAIRNIR